MVQTNELYEAWRKFCICIASNELQIPQRRVNVTEYITYKRKCMEFPVKVKINNFIKENKKYKNIISNIKSSLEQGKGISMYLSKRAKKLKDDKMFLDFGILHLHFNKKCGNKIIDVAKNTGETLQIYYSKGTVYIFNIGRHGNGAYTNINDLQKLYDSFPNSLDDRLIYNERSVNSYNISSDTRYNFRKLNCNTLSSLKLNNGYYKKIYEKYGYNAAGESFDDFFIGREIMRKKFQNLYRFLFYIDKPPYIVYRDVINRNFIIKSEDNETLFKINNDKLINALIR